MPTITADSIDGALVESLMAVPIADIDFSTFDVYLSGLSDSQRQVAEKIRVGPIGGIVVSRKGDVGCNLVSVLDDDAFPAHGLSWTDEAPVRRVLSILQDLLGRVSTACQDLLRGQWQASDWIPHAHLRGDVIEMWLVNTKDGRRLALLPITLASVVRP